MAEESCVIPTIVAASAALGLRLGTTVVLDTTDFEAVIGRLGDVLRACKAAFVRPKQKPHKIAACVVEDGDYTAFTVKVLGLEGRLVLDLFVSAGSALMARAFLKQADACVQTTEPLAPFELNKSFRTPALSPEATRELPVLTLEEIEDGVAPIIHGLASPYFDCQRDAALTACRLLYPDQGSEGLSTNFAAQSPALFDALCDSLLPRFDTTIKAVAARALRNAFYHRNSVAYTRFTSRLDVLAGSLASEDKDDLWSVWSKRSVVEVFLHLSRSQVLFPDTVTAAIQHCLQTTDDGVLHALCAQYLSA